MSERTISAMPTPETDAAIWLYYDNGQPFEVIDTDFARKLERERDEAREEIEALRHEYHGAKAMAGGFKDKIKSLTEQRDEARELLESEKITRNHIIQRGIEMQKERDEAREALMKIEEVFIDSDDTYEDWRKMGNIARAVLEAAKHDPVT